MPELTKVLFNREEKTIKESSHPGILPQHVDLLLKANSGYLRFDELNLKNLVVNPNNNGSLISFYFPVDMADLIIEIYPHVRNIMEQYHTKHGVSPWKSGDYKIIELKRKPREAMPTAVNYYAQNPIIPIEESAPVEATTPVEAVTTEPEIVQEPILDDQVLELTAPITKSTKKSRKSSH